MARERGVRPYPQGVLSLSRGGSQGQGAQVGRATENAWGISLDDATLPDSETRISDFAAFFAISFPGFLLPLVGVPAGEVAALGLGLIALFRTSDRLNGQPVWFTWAMVAIPLWLLGSGLLNNDLDLKRLAHMASYALLALALASGRIAIPSAVRGLMWGLPLSVAVSVAGAGNGYVGRLDGLIGDPNAAAYYLLVLGLVVMAYCSRTLVAVLFGLFTAVSVVLTYSRTGLTVLIVAVPWLSYGRRLRLLAAAVSLAVTGWLVRNVSDDLRLWGPFADREGSDALRLRIIASEQAQVADAPLWGNGPGTSSVDLGGQTFFFHSSYYGVLNEGGWPLLVVLLAVLAGVFAALTNGTGRGTRRTACLQMAMIASLMMAFTLGEVLLDLPMAVVLGVGIRHAMLTRPRPAEADGPETRLLADRDRAG